LDNSQSLTLVITRIGVRKIRYLKIVPILKGQEKGEILYIPVIFAAILPG
jgi:hypothetical protein